MGEFNLDGHYIYYCGQESLRRSGVVLTVNKRVRNAVLGCNLKNDRVILVFFQGKPFNITVIQIYDPTTDAEETEVEQFHEDLQENTKKDAFYYRGLECKSKKKKIHVVQASLTLEYKMKQVKANSFFKRTPWSQQTPSSNNTKDDYTHGDHLKINIKTRLIYSLQPNMEKLYRVSENKTGS